MEREVSENSRVMVSDRVVTMLGFGMEAKAGFFLEDLWNVRKWLLEDSVNSLPPSWRIIPVRKW